MVISPGVWSRRSRYAAQARRALRDTLREMGACWNGDPARPARGRSPRLEALEPRLLMAGNVVINELHVHPNLDTEEVEFVELYNAGDAAVDLSGAQFTSGITYTFPASTTLAAGAYLVVAQDPPDMLAKFNVTTYGPWTGKLSNEGETVTLRSAGGTVLDQVTYGEGFPWPVTGDLGNSMELIHPGRDNSLPGNWRSSVVSTPAMLLATQSNWRYRKGTSEPPSNWRAGSFDEGSDAVMWTTGKASIGYGDADDNTVLTDMQNNYSTLYLRNTFTIAGAVPNVLSLRLYVDDGAIVTINGTEVLRAHVDAGTMYFDSLGINHDAAWETFTLHNAASYLVAGTNTIAVHALNTTKGSSDFSFDLELSVPVNAVSATPGRKNSVYSTTQAPLLGDLQQSVQQPTSNTPMVISVKVTDSDGVQGVKFEYQWVEPGAYIRVTDSAYLAAWPSLAMHDDGLNGDAVAGDSIYSIALPANWQVHRRLVRYRIAATDLTGLSIRAPYADDPQPNFAYFVYDGVPGWTGSNYAGAPVTTFGPEITGSQSVYHLIASASDVNNSQYVSSYQQTGFRGTIVYDGVVYDHITFQVRGEFSTYQSGKNKWRIDFNTGHDFAARDNYGNLYAEKWRQLNLNANASPWMPINRGMAGLDEAVSYRLYQLAGLAASNTNYVAWRVIDDAAEAPAGNQYGGDLWGLYLAIENPGGRFIDEHGLEDGNLYKIENNLGDSTNQSPDQPSDGSDWITFRNGATSTATLPFWRENVNLDAFYSFNAINRVVSNVDLREGWNHLMYHAPNDLWQPIPWDLDMMYAPRTHQSGVTRLNYALLHPSLRTEYANRARELIDLLFSNGSRTGGQVGQLVEEYARMVNEPDGNGGYLTGWAELDQYMWNYHTRTTNPHRGQFYVSPKSDNRYGGTWTRTLVSNDLEGMAQYAINFMTNTDTDGWSLNDGDPNGYGYKYLQFEASDGIIPNKPITTYSGPAGFPVNRLTFSTSGFSHPAGAAFAAMEWRIGEISNPSTPGFNANQPWKYEIDSVWESGELTTYAPTITIPGGVLQEGHTYRVRVRMKDSTGRWSNWSAVTVAGTQFVAGASTNALQNALRITELNYHPADVGPASPGSAADAEEYEFIELKNVSDATINLEGVAFTNGITYTFGDVSLEAGKVGVLVKNTAAFRSRYGDATQILGDYAAGGRFDNAGEHVVLVDDEGQSLYDFTYDDTGAGWHAATDGDGYSLTVINPAAKLDLNNPGTWRASFSLNGNPGVDGLSGDATGDGVVDAFDLNILAARWQTAAAGSATAGDFNGDGFVDAFDLNVMAAYWQAGVLLNFAAALESYQVSLTATPEETPSLEAPPFLPSPALSLSPLVAMEDAAWGFPGMAHEGGQSPLRRRRPHILERSRGFENNNRGPIMT